MGFPNNVHLSSVLAYIRASGLREQLKVEYLKRRSADCIVANPAKYRAILSVSNKMRQHSKRIIYVQNEQLAKTQPYLEPSVQNPARCL